MTNPHEKHTPHCGPAHDHARKRRDWFLWICATLVGASLILSIVTNDLPYDWLALFTASTQELIARMWIGVVFGMIFVGLLEAIPREIVTGLFGTQTGVGSILRATGAGFLLDLCSHGILMVAAKLYERGVRLGQVMAFLIASPWNSFSLTLILWGLIGFWWMLAFLGLSLVVAIISGLVFDALVARGVLPENPHKFETSSDIKVFPALLAFLKSRKPSWRGGLAVLKTGWRESRMILRWIFFGILLASAIRSFVPIDTFQTVFGPTLLGLGATLVLATIIEACSEGSTPIAADIFNRSQASGNAFAFLMAGAATDYTEIMVLREATKRWKIALFLPLVTLPQVIIIAILLNMAAPPI